MTFDQVEVFLVDFVCDSLYPLELTQEVLLFFPEICMPFLLAEVLFLELLGQAVNFVVVEFDDVLLLILQHLARLELNSADFLENFFVLFPYLLQTDAFVGSGVELSRLELFVQIFDNLSVLLLSDDVLLKPLHFEHLELLMLLDFEFVLLKQARVFLLQLLRGLSYKIRKLSTFDSLTLSET